MICERMKRNDNSGKDAKAATIMALIIMNNEQLMKN